MIVCRPTPTKRYTRDCIPHPLSTLAIAKHYDQSSVLIVKPSIRAVGFNNLTMGIDVWSSHQVAVVIGPCILF